MPEVGFRHTQEARLKMSAARLGIPFTSEHKAKIAEALRGKHLTEERRLKISIARQRACPDIAKLKKLYSQEEYSMGEIKQIFSTSHKIIKRWVCQLGILRQGISHRTREKLKAARKGQLVLTPEAQKKLSQAQMKICPNIEEVKRLYYEEGYGRTEIAVIFNCHPRVVKRWLTEAGIPLRKSWSSRTRAKVRAANCTPEAFKKRFQALRGRPTKPERQLSELLAANSLPYRYVGDGEFILGGKCPDFLNVDGQKKLLELFGIFWHDPFDIARRTEHFRQYGFDLLCIWEDELKDPDKVVAKIKSFNRRRVNHGEIGLSKAPSSS